MKLKIKLTLEVLILFNNWIMIPQNNLFLIPHQLDYIKRNVNINE